MIKTKPKPQNWKKKRRRRLEFWLIQREETFDLIWGGLNNNPKTGACFKKGEDSNKEDEDQGWVEVGKEIKSREMRETYVFKKREMGLLRLFFKRKEFHKL